MTRITLMSAAAALVLTPAAMAQYEDPDNAYMNESPTRQDRVQRGEDFYDDDNVDTSGTMGAQLTNTDQVRDADLTDRTDRDRRGRYAADQLDGQRATNMRREGDMDMHRDAMVQPASMRIDRQSRLEQLFQAIDMDGNGTVSQAEWGEWQSDTGRAYRFGEFNQNNDNSLSWSEYRQAADRMYDSVS